MKGNLLFNHHYTCVELCNGSWKININVIDPLLFNLKFINSILQFAVLKVKWKGLGKI